MYIPTYYFVILFLQDCRSTANAFFVDGRRVVLQRVRRNSGAEIFTVDRHPLPLFAGDRQVQIQPVAPQRNGETSSVRAGRTGRYRARRVAGVDIQTGRRGNAVPERRSISRKTEPFGIATLQTEQTGSV